MPIYIGSGTGNLVYDPSLGCMKYGDSTISTQIPVYTWGYHPNPWDVPFGTEILIHPSCLTGSGANTQGIKLRSDNTNWLFADSGQILYSKSGTIAAPLVSGVAGNGASEVSMWGSLNPIMIPGLMLYKNVRCRLMCTLIKTGANATWEAWIRFGDTAPGGSISQNDQIHVVSSLTNATGRQYQIDTTFIYTSAGIASAGAGETAAAVTTKMYITPNGQQTGAVADKTGHSTTVSPSYANINIKGNAADTFSLLDYTFIAMPI